MGQEQEWWALLHRKDWWWSFGEEVRKFCVDLSAFELLINLQLGRQKVLLLHLFFVSGASDTLSWTLRELWKLPKDAVSSPVSRSVLLSSVIPQFRKATSETWGLLSLICAEFTFFSCATEPSTPSGCTGLEAGRDGVLRRNDNGRTVEFLIHSFLQIVNHFWIYLHVEFQKISPNIDRWVGQLCCRKFWWGILRKIEACRLWRIISEGQVSSKSTVTAISFFTCVVLQPQNKYRILQCWPGTTVQVWSEMAYLQIPACLASLQLLVRSGYTVCHGRITWSPCWRW